MGSPNSDEGTYTVVLCIYKNLVLESVFTPHCLKDGAGVGDGQDDTFSGHQVTNLKVVVVCQLTQVASAKASPADQRLVPP